MTEKNERIYFLLQQATHLIRKESDRELMETTGITTPQAAVLSLVNDEESVSQKKIAETLSVNESAVTTMVGRLEKEGFIAREPCPDNWRAKQIRLTSKGEDAITGIQEISARMNSKLKDLIGGDQVRQLAASLGSIIEEFSD